MDSNYHKYISTSINKCLLFILIKTTAYLPWELSQRYLSGDLSERFDIMVSYSSLEHGGLGRFGDALHPWGDLVTMAKAWCLVKKGGMAVIAVPTARQDTIEYNAHR